MSILVCFFVCVYFRIEGGELFERVVDDDFVLTERAVTMFMKQIVEGVRYIHSQQVLHLDMKVNTLIRLLFGAGVPKYEKGLVKMVFGMAHETHMDTIDPHVRMSLSNIMNMSSALTVRGSIEL